MVHGGTIDYTKGATGRLGPNLYGDILHANAGATTRGSVCAILGGRTRRYAVTLAVNEGSLATRGLTIFYVMSFRRYKISRILMRLAIFMEGYSFRG